MRRMDDASRAGTRLSKRSKPPKRPPRPSTRGSSQDEARRSPNGETPRSSQDSPGRLTSEAHWMHCDTKTPAPEPSQSARPSSSPMDGTGEAPPPTPQKDSPPKASPSRHAPSEAHSPAETSRSHSRQIHRTPSHSTKPARHKSWWQAHSPIPETPGSPLMTRQDAFLPSTQSPSRQMPPPQPRWRFPPPQFQARDSSSHESPPGGGCTTRKRRGIPCPRGRTTRKVPHPLSCRQPGLGVEVSQEVIRRVPGDGGRGNHTGRPPG